MMYTGIAKTGTGGTVVVKQIGSGVGRYKPRIQMPGAMTSVGKPMSAEAVPPNGPTAERPAGVIVKGGFPSEQTAPGTTVVIFPPNGKSMPAANAGAAMSDTPSANTEAKTIFFIVL